jgi:hypothetical protein
MEKTMVTIQEFESKGGIIDNGRELFYKDGNHKGYYDHYEMESSMHIIHNTTNKSLAISGAATFVEIEDNQYK